MSSISIVYRKDKLNKKGLAPIHFRIIKNRKTSYISSGILIEPALWDEKNKKVKNKAQNSARLNSYISTKFAELQDQFLELESKENYSTKLIKEKIYGKKEQDFMAFGEQVLQEYLSNKQISTHDKNKAVLAKLAEYIGDKKISFNDVDYNFLSKYEQYLRAEKLNKTNTVAKDLKFFRKMFNEAYRQDIIEHNINPFNKYKIKTEKTQRDYLNEDELKLFEEYKATPGTKKELHQDMFVFSCYCGGIRISDILLMKWANFDGTHLSWSTQKTSTQSTLKVPTKALEIIEKYTPKNIDPNHFLFPMLNNDLEIDDPRAVDTAISRGTAYVNKNIKAIGLSLNITKNISFHVSRHTWATRALRKGISIDKVSKLMGHAAIRETQIYAKIVSEELDKAMDAFN